MALLLKRLGITRVRPLEGGLEAWRKLDYPIAPPPASGPASAGGAAAPAESYDLGA